jgi:hypothetical protein
VREGVEPRELLRKEGRKEHTEGRKEGRNIRKGHQEHKEGT